jgi:hypothetical protein
MQTVPKPIQLAALYQKHGGIMRGVLAAVVGIVVLVTSSCSSAGLSFARVQGRAEQEHGLSSCEAAYQGAQQDQTDFDSAITLVQRAQASRSSQQHWIDVATYCTGRFAEGSMNSALAAYRLSELEGTSGLSVSLNELPTDAIATSNLSVTEASAIALAEDRAGFGVEVLAARTGGSSEMLELSDNHKLLAQSLVSLHSKATDPREKLYSVQKLLANPTTITDSTTGLSTSTTGQIEMDTARAIIEAMTASTAESTADSSAESTISDGDSGSATGSSSSSASGSSASTGSTADTDGSADTRSSAQRLQSLKIAAQIASSRAFAAFSLGYPAFKAAVLDGE